MTIYPRLTFKITSTSDTTGIVDRFYRPLLAANRPVGIMVIAGQTGVAGPVMELINLAKSYPGYDMSQLFIHYRIAGYVPGDSTRYIDVPNYNIHPATAAADDFKIHKARWMKDFGADWEEAKQHVIWQVNNEPRKEATEWLAQYSIGLLELGKAEGLKQSVMAWSTGTPDYESWNGYWMRQLVHYLEENRGSAWLALHEYSLDPTRLDVEHLVGRWQMTDVLSKVGLIFPEFGWAERDMPTAHEAMAQIDALYSFIYAYPNIEGLALWTLDKNWGGIHNKLLDLMPLLTEWMLSNAWGNYEPPPAPPPAPPLPPPPAPISNLFTNPGFEKGWTDQGSSQKPNGWDIGWNTSPSVVSGKDFVEGEIVHKGRRELPPDEWGYITGDYCLKIFGGNFPFWGRLSQNVKTKPGKKYKAIVRGTVDSYKWDKELKKRVYIVDPQQAEVSVLFDRFDRHSFFPTKSQQGGPVKWVFEAYYVAQDVETRVSLQFLSHWGISTAFFVDEVEMIEVEGDNPVDELEFDEGWLWDQAMALAPLNMDAAIQKQILKDGLLPLGPERWFRQTNGKRVAVQPAIDDNLKRYVYLAEVDKWDKVWVMKSREDNLDPSHLPLKRRVAITHPESVMMDSQRDPRWANNRLGTGLKTKGNWGCLFFVNRAQYIYEQGEIGVEKFESQYIKAGSFSGSNLVPGALSKAYPSVFRNHGWLPRGHKDFIPTMIAMLEKNLPVAIRVDFKPLTPEEEQHWVLVTEAHQLASGEWDFIILDPWSDDPVPQYLSETYNIAGIDALELLWYEREPQSEELVDLRYIFPISTGDMITLRHYGGDHNGHEEHTQYNRLGKLVKGGNYEEIWWDDSAGAWMRRIDTSHSNDKFYWILDDAGDPVKWLPRQMRVGESYTRYENVRISYKHRYEITDSYRATTTIKLIQVIENYPLPDGSSEDAFVFEALDYRGVAFERYVYAEGVGMVRWDNLVLGNYSEIVAISSTEQLPIPADPPAVKELKRHKGW